MPPCRQEVTDHPLAVCSRRLVRVAPGATQRDRLYVFTRDPEAPERLISQGLDEGEVLELIRSLAGPDLHGSGDSQSNAGPARSGRIAKLRTTIMRRLRLGSNDVS